MAVNKTKEIAKQEVESMVRKSEINEAYFTGLLWADPFNSYGEYSDNISQDEFLQPVWSFYFELGRKMFEEGIKTFDTITVATKVKEYNVSDEFTEYGGMRTIEDAIDIVKSHSDNIEYYYETIKKNYTVQQLYLLFGDKVLVKKNKYNYELMNREQLTTYWTDKMNQISLGSLNNYEAENLYIEADEFIRKLEEESAEMLPFYNSYLMNSITQGVARGHVFMFGGFGNTGKALALDTPIPTPVGWTTMGELQVGDTVFGEDGKPTNVIYKSPVFENHNVYEVEFDDGEKILADAEHQWSVKTEYSTKLARRNIGLMKGKHVNENGFYTVTTEEIIGDFARKRKDGKGYSFKYKVPMNSAVEYKERDLLVKPYTLGVWLGDGTSSNGEITVYEEDLEDMQNNLKNDGYNFTMRNHRDKIYTILLKNPYKETHCERGHDKNKFWNSEKKKCRECDRLRHSATYNNSIISDTIPKYYKSVMQQLREINVLDNKHIPREYLESSVEQRYELLRGLMDTDGYTDKNGYCEFSQSKKRIVDDFSELLSSLGIKHSVNRRTTSCNGKDFESYRVVFSSDKNNSCFKMKRKHNKLPDNLLDRRKQKSIVNIKQVESIPTQCIMVDNDSHLYLAGKRMTVTHNSSIMADKFVMSCIANKEKLLIVLNEEDAQAFRQKIVLSILNHEFNAGFDRKRMVNGKLQESDKELIRKAFNKMKELIDGEESQIKIIFMERYVMKDLEKIVRFWANRQYINLVIDTHKVSDESSHEKRWETFVEDMKTIYRLTRKNAGGCNLRTWVNFQLSDSAIRNRFLGFDAMAEGKAAKNEASVVMMFRPCFSDEYEGGKKQLDCYRLKKKANGDGYEKEFFNLEKGKTYYLVFSPKNRFGSNTDNGQPVLVLEPAFHRNAFYEKGWTFVAKDYQ